MKKALTVTFLVGLVLSASRFAAAQSGAADSPDSATPTIAAARCAYTQGNELCSPAPAVSGNDRTVRIAQSSRHGYPPPPPMHLARPEDGPSVKGALIGGLIGFGLGAAKSGDSSARARVGLGIVVGSIGAVLGAAIGANHSYYRHYHRYRYEPWPYDYEEETASAPKPPRRRSVQPADVHSTASHPDSSAGPTAKNSAPEGTRTTRPASDK